MPASKKQNLRWLRWAGTLISSGLFIWLLARQNWRAILASIWQLPAWVLPAAILLYFSGMLANAVRWWILLQAQKIDIPFGEILKIVLVGAFSSNFLPSTIGGDALRIVALLNYTPDKTLSAASVVVDRLLNVLATLTFTPLVLLTFGSPAALIQIFKNQASQNLWLGGPALPRLLRKISGWWGHLWRTFQIWLRHPGTVLSAFGVAWYSILAVFCAVWLIGRGLRMEVSLLQVSGVMTLTYFLTLLPISLNGYGLREVAVTTLYVYLGATTEQAVTLAVVTRFITMLETLPGAVWLSPILSLSADFDGGID